MYLTLEKVIFKSDRFGPVYVGGRAGGCKADGCKPCAESFSRQVFKAPVPPPCAIVADSAGQRFLPLQSTAEVLTGKLSLIRYLLKTLVFEQRLSVKRCADRRISHA